MRHEAAKHGIPNASAKKDSDLCDIARLYYPGTLDCNEDLAKTHAKEIYPHLCKPEYKLPGVDCNVVKDELKKAYPAVDKGSSPKKAKSMATKIEKKCILPWCAPAQTNVSCTEAEQDFDARDKNKNIDWTTDDDVCSSFLATRKQNHLSSPKKRTRSQVCIKEDCEVLAFDSRLCSYFEDILEDLNSEYDFTTDDDACGKSVAPRNATAPVALQSTLLKARTSFARNAGQRICVLPWCNGLDKDACGKMRTLLGNWAKEDHLDIDYTTDEEVCKDAKDILVFNSTTKA